jgi:hypothetical protein
MIFTCYHLNTSQHEYPTSSQCDNTSILRSRGPCNLTTASTTLSYSAIVGMTRQHDSTSTLCHGQVAPAASLPTWLNNIAVSMARYLHHIAAKSTWQRHCQHDSTSTSHHGQVTRQRRHQHDSASTSHRTQFTPAASTPAWLCSIIASMTKHLHHATTKSS